MKGGQKMNQKSLISKPTHISNILKKWINQYIKYRHNPVKTVTTYVLLIIIILFNVLFNVSFVDGLSMENNFHTNDVAIGQKYLIKSYHLNDIVGFNPPAATHDQNKIFIKRIAGTPGDTVKITNNNVYVNGKRFVVKNNVAMNNANYGFFDIYNLNGKPVFYNNAGTKIKLDQINDIETNFRNGGFAVYHIPAHQYLVLGDNRPISEDSRVFGLIDVKSINYKYIFYIHSFSHIKSTLIIWLIIILCALSAYCLICFGVTMVYIKLYR